MTAAWKTMTDTIGASASNIPNSVAYIAGYVSGTADVEWTPVDWERFTSSIRVRIWQGFKPYTDIHEFDVIDVEAGAVTPQQAADAVEARVSAGIDRTCIYASRANLQAVTDAVKAKGANVFIGHIEYWVADWNLSETEAAALLDTFIDDVQVVAVQWASPTSNPDTIVYGGGATLRACNADLSVVHFGWIPSFTAPKPPPPPPVAKKFYGMLVTFDATGGFVSRSVSSPDGTVWS